MSLRTPWQPSDSEPWTIKRVVHLHRRAGFAATWEELQRDLNSGPKASIDRLVSGKAATTGTPADFERLSVLIGTAARQSNSPDRLKAWWMYRMLFSPDPLGERLTLMWHNHFATSNQKVDSLPLMKQQNDAFRRLARAPFGELLREMIHDPALLIWLDAPANRKGHPNENLARELMELFSLGEGNYTETDVKEAARCLTGLSVFRESFRERPKEHDEGRKTLFGKTGRYSSRELVTILLDHPACAKRIAWRLCDTFLGESLVSEPVVDELAGHLRSNDLDVGSAVELILRSELFFSDANLNSRVRSPAQFVVGTVRALELIDPPPSTLVLAEAASGMGQDLFFPPNVFGWDGGRAWINTRTMVSRANFGASLVHGTLHSPPLTPDFQTLAERHAGAESDESIVEFFSDLLFGQRLDESATENLMVKTEGRDRDHGRNLVSGLLDLPLAHLG